MFPETIETERLELRRADQALESLDLYEICSRSEMEEITEYMPWDPHDTPAESADFLDRVETRWSDNEAANWAIYPRDTGGDELAGMTGLSCDWERATATLGLWLRKKFWGRGYSSERANALMNVAFERLDMDCVAVTHH
ncbi:MAG: GNAT family N-acetyltransferase, partial [Halobacteriaceae archaeon]